jgi:hypothetical protein
MSINLTRVRAKINNIKTKLYYDQPEPLRLLNINEELLVMEKDWFMPIQATSNLAVGAEYWELFIADVPDNVDLEVILTLATVAEVNGEQYRILQYTRPRGATKQWNIRLESTGERKE